MAKKNWIAGAIKHPGAEKKAAKRAGMTTHSYMEKEKDAPGKAGQRARLGLKLEGMHSGGGKHEPVKTDRGDFKFKENKPNERPR